MWKNFYSDYFSFTKRQRRGLYVLIAIILSCMVIPLLFPYLKKEPKKDPSDFKRSVAAFLEAQQKKKDSDQQIEYFPFDPNKISKAQWEKLGVSHKVATTILHYREAGGKFYKKEDLQKIYGLSEKTYKLLLPYVQIEKSAKKPKVPTSGNQKSYRNTGAETKKSVTEVKPRKRTLASVDINKADSMEWVALYGIGPVLSARIVRFRNALGGFYKKEQIAEVYHLPDSTFEHIKKQLTISTISLKKLDINQASAKHLAAHPYIDYRLARSIVAFRERHGKFDSLSELKELQLVNDKIYRKIAPYLKIK